MGCTRAKRSHRPAGEAAQSPEPSRTEQRRGWEAIPKDAEENRGGFAAARAIPGEGKGRAAQPSPAVPLGRRSSLAPGAGSQGINPPVRVGAIRRQ